MSTYLKHLNQLSDQQRRFKHVVTLPRHPDHPAKQKHGDPRKQWLYDGYVAGSWRVEADSMFDWQTPSEFKYMFENESDALLFTLKWV